VGDTDQDWFLNTVAEVKTSISPLELLKALLAIENQLGRVRTRRWGPRNIDLDLLLYGSTTMDTAELTLPHPRMTERAFVMVPLADLNPVLMMPGNITASQLAESLRNAQQITPYPKGD
jgi:2-amino-4-hydroxy-6-hydroxymethyldihydropteridine diphosphokinase